MNESQRRILYRALFVVVGLCAALAAFILYVVYIESGCADPQRLLGSIVVGFTALVAGLLIRAGGKRSEGIHERQRQAVYVPLSLLVFLGGAFWAFTTIVFITEPERRGGQDAPALRAAGFPEHLIREYYGGSIQMGMNTDLLAAGWAVWFVVIVVALYIRAGRNRARVGVDSPVNANLKKEG